MKAWAWAIAVGALVSGSPAHGVPAQEIRTHLVQPGDSLWSIAAHHLGGGRRWRELYRANRDQIVDPALLYVGQRLALPRPGDEDVAAPAPAPR